MNKLIKKNGGTSMKKRKILSLFLSLCLLISLLPTVALAAYPDSNEAGFKLETDSYTDGVLTVSGHVKLPTAEGISSFNVVLSWDSAVLTLLKRSDANVKYTPTNSKTTYPLSIETFLINGATEEKFGVSEADLYGEAGRAGFKINLYSTGGSIAAQKTTDWVKAFAIKFEVSRKPTDASTVLNSDSLRIADPVKDADVIKGAFPANDTYTIQVQDAADPAKIYNYGKMAGNNRPETANNFMMTAPGTGTATYPGSTSVTPPAPATLTGITVKTAPDKVTYNEGDSFDATGMVIEATYSDSSKKNVTGYTYAPTAALTTSDTEVTISYTEGGVTKTCTQAITVNAVTPPAPATLTGIAVKTAPDKVDYTEGETFDATGMVIEATYSDSSKKDVTTYTYTPTGALTTSDTTITISYTEDGVTKTCTQGITVNAVTPPTPTEYTITFNVNGGSGTIPSQTTSGQKLSSLPTATHSGSYSFAGWYTAASGGTQITTAYTFSADTTVYAHWTYTGGGGSYYAPVVPDMPMLYRGCTGDAVKTLQEKLNAKGFDSGNVDGIFGAKTYAAATAFQKANGLGVDGIVGKLTWAKLYDATPVNVTPVTTQPMLRTGSRGDAVRKLQELLNAKGYTCGSVDGIFGSKTYAAVLAFQKANGLGADGIVGPLTWGKLV